MNTSSITRFTARTGLKLKKHSPQILFYAGIIGTVATTVVSSRATLKAVPIVERLKVERSELDTVMVSQPGRISGKEYQQEVVRQYTVTSMQLTRLYGPPAILGIVSIAALTKSHRQLTTRNQALTVAFTGLFKTFEGYRGRVREQLGDDIDQQFLHGTVMQEVESTNSKGVTKTKEIAMLDPGSTAAYTYYFDASVPSWTKDPGYNQTYLDGVQDWCNVLLRKQGFMFLNEVYDRLQLPKTREGNLVGWVFDDLGDNDMFIDFGHHKDGEFVAGFKRDVMLEFNIHGPILDLI